jgi:predicted dehydrogenase
MVGFNRRFAAATSAVRKHFEGLSPLVVNFRFSPGPIPADHWTQDEDIGGGRIVGEACHAIDTCTAIVGSPPVRVFAESVAKTNGVETTDDRVLITLRHVDGSISSVSYQAGGDKAFPSERIEVFGGGRVAVVDNWNGIELWSGGRLKRSSGSRDKGHLHEVAAFANACRTGQWPIPWDQLYNVSWAALAAVQSLRDGMPQRIDAPAAE